MVPFNTRTVPRKTVSTPALFSSTNYMEKGPTNPKWRSTKASFPTACDTASETWTRSLMGTIPVNSTTIGCKAPVLWTTKKEISIMVF